MMQIKDIKQKMLKWTDFYGGDIPYTDLIEKAKTKEDLKIVLETHRSLLENTLIDAMTHLDEFKKSLFE
jgi:hypothetical protein